MAPRLWHRRCPAETAVEGHPRGLFGVWALVKIKSPRAPMRVHIYIDVSGGRGEHPLRPWTFVGPYPVTQA
jgi:hypothetical protein